MTENVEHELLTLPEDDFQPMKYFQLGEMRICAGCQKYISDTHCLLMDNRAWHDECLKCRFCHAAPSQSCYVKNGQVFCCKDHYKRMYPLSSCARCGCDIMNGARIIRVGELIYHEVCCRCARCDREVRPRETCTFNGSLLHCNNCSGLSCSFEEVDEMIPNQYQQCDFSDRKLMKRSRKTSLPIDPKAPTRYGSDYRRDPNPGYPPQKAKRIRTSFTTEQLTVMKQYFEANPNPDATTLQRLAGETNLHKRTLQIWFQNTRAKHRRKDKTKSAGKKFKNGSESVKSEKEDYPDDDVERLANDSANSVDSKHVSEKGDGQSFSGSVLEGDSRSPGLESFSGDSRSDTAESSSTPSVPWTLDGLYQPDYQRLQPGSYGRNPAGIYHCTDKLDEHIHREIYNSDNGEAENFDNFNEYISSNKPTYSEMYNSLAR